MLDESLRTRLEALNRAPIPAQQRLDGAAVSPGLSLPKSAAVRPTPRPAIAPTPHPTTTKPTAGLLRSGDIVETPHGPHLRIRLPLETLWPNGLQLIISRQEFLHSQLTAAQQAVEPSLVLAPEFASLVGALPDRAI